MTLETFFQNPLYTGILGAFAGVAITLATKFGEGWIDEYYAEKERKKVRKREAAKAINRFVIYGKHNDFKWKAESEKEIKIIAQEIMAFDSQVGEKLRQFLINWSMYRNITKDKSDDFIEAVDARRFNKKAHNLGQELLKVAEEWSK